MNEAEQTRALANRILDRPNGDPDDDLAMLARQLMRADERIAQYKNLAVETSHKFPQQCGLCNGVLETKDDRDWHGLGNCVEICSRCSGSGIDHPITAP